MCIRDETKLTIHCLEETFHATVVSHIIVQPGRHYYYDEDAKIESVIVCFSAHCVHLYLCVRVCVCYIEIAGCHAVSHPMISDINNRRGPALSHSDS